MHYLFPHGHNEEHQPVEKKYWPKDRYIERTEECQYKSDAEGLCDTVPELELRKASNKGPKLIGSMSREQWRVCILRVDLRRQKSDQQIQQVDSETVRDDVEPFDKVDA